MQVVINGFCGSSCMSLASEARPYVCITPRAEFAFHRTNYGDPIPLARDLDAWIRKRGGYPPFSGVPGRMSYEAARAFWPPCGPRAPEGGCTNNDPLKCSAACPSQFRLAQGRRGIKIPQGASLR